MTDANAFLLTTAALTLLAFLLTVGVMAVITT